MIPILIFIGLFLFASNPVMLAVINEVKLERPAFINGVYMTVNFVISAITVTLVGVLGDIIGLDAMYKVVSFSPLLALPFIMSLYKNKDTQVDRLFLKPLKRLLFCIFYLLTHDLSRGLTEKKVHLSTVSTVFLSPMN